jgi:hypothetical protein
MIGSFMAVIFSLAALAVCTLVLSLRFKWQTVPAIPETDVLRLRSSVSAAQLQAQPGHWPLAATATYAIRNGQCWDRFPYEERLGERGEFKRLFRQYWGVVDRRSMLRCLHWLLTGGHRATFDTMIGYYAKLTDTEANHLLLDIARDPHLDDSERTERSWQLRAVRANADRIRAVDFLAWDLLRYIELCRMATTAGLLQRHEAEDCALIAARELQRAFASWQDCADHFLRARRFWIASDDEASMADHASFVDAVATLGNSVDSPWRKVSWSMELPEPRWLLVRALIEIDQPPLLRDDDDEVYAIATTMDGVARRMMEMPRFGT